MARRRDAGWWLLALAALAVVLAAGLNALSSRLLPNKLTQDIAHTLACEAAASDTVYTVGEFPYDLPFFVRADHPMVVVQDWSEIRRSAGDNWRRELFEGADFDAAAAHVLQLPEVLAIASRQPGQWLVAPRSLPQGAWQDGWQPVQQGKAWNLYRSAPDSAPESPEAAQHIGLPGCQHQGHEQRRH